MSDLPLNDQTSEALGHFLKSPSHAVVLTGASGVGKATIALDLVAQLLDTSQPSGHPGLLRILPDEKGTISIDRIREIQHFFSLKSNSTTPISRIVIIEDAHLMPAEAQNSTLKLLEEPPTDGLIILTATSPQALLPTILSRVVQITVAKPAEKHLLSHFKRLGHTDAAITQAYNISGGLPGLMSAVLDQDEAHPLHEAVTEARRILSSNSFERLCLVDQLSKQREAAIRTCEMLQQMATVALRASKDPKQLSRWQTVLEQALLAATDLNRYVQPKLVLTRFLLSF